MRWVMRLYIINAHGNTQAKRNIQYLHQAAAMRKIAAQYLLWNKIAHPGVPAAAGYGSKQALER